MKPSPDKFNINKMAGVILYIKKETSIGSELKTLVVLRS